MTAYIFFHYFPAVKHVSVSKSAPRKCRPVATCRIDRTERAKSGLSVTGKVHAVFSVLSRFVTCKNIYISSEMKTIINFTGLGYIFPSGFCLIVNRIPFVLDLCSYIFVSWVVKNKKKKKRNSHTHTHTHTRLCTYVRYYVNTCTRAYTRTRTCINLHEYTWVLNCYANFIEFEGTKKRKVKKKEKKKKRSSVFRNKKNMDFNFRKTNKKNLSALKNT